MYCCRCKREASLYIKSYNSAFCNDCFVYSFLRRLQQTIDKFKMFSANDNILVAVSGGVDSLSLWDALNCLGYNTEGLHINLGIGDYSHLSQKITEDFSHKRNLKLNCINIKDIFKRGIEEIAKIYKRISCRTCGMIKRYIMNKETENYSCLATGHNLDDEAAALFGNIINWQEGFLSRQYPVLEERDTLKRKVKPFIFILEQEIAYYAYIKKIKYIEDECPLSLNSPSSFYKNILNQIELKMPGVKSRFLKGFLEREYFKNKGFTSSLNKCKICGYLTVAETCNFCRLREKVSQVVGIKN